MQSWCFFAEDINKAKTHIFTSMRGKDGLTVQEKHAYNMETLRIRKAGGDNSKRKLFMLYFSTTFRNVDLVSF